MNTPFRLVLAITIILGLMRPVLAQPQQPQLQVQPQSQVQTKPQAPQPQPISQNQPAAPQAQSQVTTPAPQTMVPPPPAAVIPTMTCECIPEMEELFKSHMSNTAVIVWATDVIRTLFNFNYDNANEVLEYNRKYFNPNGYAHFLEALEASKILSNAKQQKYIVKANIYTPPTILKQGQTKDRWGWQLEVPVTITYTGSLDVKNQDLKIKMVVFHAPKEGSYRGLAIEQLLMSEG